MTQGQHALDDGGRLLAKRVSKLQGVGNGLATISYEHR